MNRLFHPLLAGGLALLLIGLLAALLFPAANAAPQSAACEPANEVAVPDDCVIDNLFRANRPGQGGGALLRNASEALVQHNRFVASEASSDQAAGPVMGGGLLLEQANSEQMTATVARNHFLRNTVASQGAVGGGAAIVSVVDFTLVNNVFAANAGAEAAGLFLAAHPTAQEANELWHNTPPRGAGGGVFDDQNSAVGDPVYVDPANEDYHVRKTSAARNAGDPAGIPPAPETDLADAARLFGERVDIGAYEWRGALRYFPLMGRNACPLPACAGWAVGQDRDGNAAIVHTSDGGLTWRSQGDPALLAGFVAGDVSAVDQRTAWVALLGPDQGRILHTSDGGATWISQPLPSGLADGIKSVKGLSRSEAWAASLGGEVLHTGDGGATWTVAPHPGAPITQVNRMDVVGEHIWIADASPQGAVVYSHDRGQAWQMGRLMNDGQPDSPLTVHAASAEIVWASGTGSLTFYRSLNGGADWAKAANVGGFDHLDDICASSAEDVWGVTNGGGMDGRIKRVVAPVGGEPQPPFDVTPEALRGYMPGGVTCLDSRVAWVVGQQGPIPEPAKPDGVILRTLDDGKHWMQAVAPADIHFWKISMAGARR